MKGRMRFAHRPCARRVGLAHHHPVPTRADKTHRAKEIIAIKAGCFDKDVKQTLKPSVEIYTQDKLPFVQEKLAHVRPSSRSPNRVD